MLWVQRIAVARFLAAESFAEQGSHWTAFIAVVLVVVDVNIQAPLV